MPGNATTALPGCAFSGIPLTVRSRRASAKVYSGGEFHREIRVPMREMRLNPTRGHNGAADELNPPLRVYDTSGPYTDPTVGIDLSMGLEPRRQSWVRNRPGATYL